MQPFQAVLAVEEIADGSSHVHAVPVGKTQEPSTEGGFTSLEHVLWRKYRQDKLSATVGICLGRTVSAAPDLEEDGCCYG